jgi:hypothetical protein
METLAKICQPSKPFLLSQILLYQKELEAKGGVLEFKHKFMLRVQNNDKWVYVKMNWFDHEYYVFSDSHPIKHFHSFLDVRKWLSDYFVV